MKIYILFAALLFLTSCDSDQGSVKSPQQIQKEVEDNQRRFEEERQRINLENSIREKQLAHQRALVSATFVSADNSRIAVELINQTGKDIDNLSGSLDVLDLNGRYVTGIALTHWVPGDIYLSADQSRVAYKGLELLQDDARRKIGSEARSYIYYFTTHRYQFAGEDEINLQNGANPVQIAEQPTPPPTSLPSPCPEHQDSVITSQQYYPGPECEHVSRNLESERFKREYIILCRDRTGATSQATSVASVQIAFCGPAPHRDGIIYTKQICCAPQ